MNNLKSILRDTLTCSLWVLLFLALIQPFGIDQMHEGRISFIMGQTLLSALSIFIAKSLAYLWFGRYKDQSFSLAQYLKMSLLMHVINIPMLGFLLISFNAWFNTGDMWTYWFLNGQLTLYPLGVMCLYVASISVFVCILECFRFSNSSLRLELDDVKAINALLEKRQEKLEKEEETDEMRQTQVSDDPQDEETVATAAEPPITLIGQGLGAELTLSPSCIIYVESMANYADICYISDNETKHCTLRITLKQIREALACAEQIVQCHRAFLVNINFVVAMSSHNPGCYLQLFGMEKQIPVSRANTEIIKARLAG